MTPLERAARALHARTRQIVRVRDPENPRNEPTERMFPFVEWDALPQSAKDGYAETVRAVLTATREADRAMTEAGGEQVLDTEVGAGQYASIADGRGSKLMANNQAVNAWTAMIDAILAGRE
ncbi:MAG: hypothetical protein ACOY7L_17190 [Pseudomonadota bacterium]